MIFHPLAGERASAFTTHGNHSWDPHGFASGLYLARLDIHYGDGTESTPILKAVVLR